MNLLIYNPVSGNSGDELKKIQGLFSSRNLDFDTIQTSKVESIREQLTGLSENYSCIIIAGGDGTVSQVIEFMIINDIESNILIYPRGTTNEYACSLSITKDTILNYLNKKTTTQKIDVGVFNQQNIFAYSLIFGNFSHLTYETPQWLKNKLGYIAYLIYGFFGMYVFKLKRYKMKFSYNDKHIDDYFLFGSISNSYSLGKVIYLDNVSLSDGLFELVLVKSPRSFLDVRNFIKSKFNNTPNNLVIKDVVDSITVSSPKEHSWSADGEYSGRYEEIDLSVQKRKINLIVDV